MKNNKDTFFKKLLNIVNKFNNRYEYTEEEEVFKENLFTRFVDNEDVQDLSYNDVRLCAEYCYEALKIAEKRLKILSNSDKISEQLVELQYLEHLTEDDIEKLNLLCTRYKNLSKENKMLLYQLTGFNNSVNYLKDKHKDAENSVEIIEEAEKFQRIFKNDINLLKYEKKDLINENILMRNAIDFINKLSIGVIGIFSLLTIFLGYMNLFHSKHIFYQTAGISLFLMLFISMTYIFRLKINKELKINAKKQAKIVELINKKKTVYAYYTSFLDFEYNKYNSRNSKDLKYNLDEYKQFEKISIRKDTTTRALNQTFEELEEFIKNKGIPCNTSIDVFVKNISVQDRLNLRKKLQNQKEESEIILEELDVKHKAYWNLINELNENDKTNNKVIEKLINKYYEEVEKVLIKMDERREETFLENEIEEEKLETKVIDENEFKNPMS